MSEIPDGQSKLPLDGQDLAELYNFVRLAAGRQAVRFKLDSEDIAQEVILSLLKRSQEMPQQFWKDPSRLRGYVLSFVRNHCIDMFRREQRSRREQLSDAPEIPDRGTPAPLDIDLQDALDALSEQDRQLLMATLDGKPTSQIAKELSLSPKTVRHRLQRARESLKSAVEGGFTAQLQPATETLGDNEFESFEVEIAPIEVYLDPGNASETEIRAVLSALNELHRASGGLGLEFRIDGTFVCASQRTQV